MTKRTMMIVDDEQEIVDTIGKYFELDSNYNILTALNPIEALEIIKKEKVDIILSDIKMPEMNGIEFLKEIKRIDGLTQVIMMTAFSTMDIAIRCMEAGANDLVLKPFESLEDLKAVVGRAKEKIDRWKHIIKKSYKA